MGILRLISRRNRSSTTGGRSSARAAPISTTRTRGALSPRRSVVRVFATLAIPANAPRVVRVAHKSPSSAGSLTLPRATPARSPSRRWKSDIRPRKVLLLIERPRTYERPKGIVRVTSSKKLALVAVALDRRDVAASHQPLDRQDRKGRQYSGGHSLTLPTAKLSRKSKRLLSANLGSARQFDLAAAYVQGEPVRRR